MVAISTICGLLASTEMATAAMTQFVVAGVYAANAVGISDEARAMALSGGHWLATKLAIGALLGGLLPVAISIAIAVRRRRRG